jgi:hypothetical protein
MSSGSQRNLARAAGAALGIGLVVVLLAVSRPGAAGSPLPAAVRFAVAPVGELEVDPAAPRPVLADSVRPGGPRAVGSFLVRNQTGDDLAVALEGVADSTELNGLLRLRVLIGTRLAADGTLEDLLRRPLRLQLGSGEGVRLRLEAWLPGSVLSGYEGALVEVSLDPASQVLGGSR